MDKTDENSGCVSQNKEISKMETEKKKTTDGREKVRDVLGEVHTNEQVTKNLKINNEKGTPQISAPPELNNSINNLELKAKNIRKQVVSKGTPTKTNTHQRMRNHLKVNTKMSSYKMGAKKKNLFIKTRVSQSNSLKCSLQSTKAAMSKNTEHDIYDFNDDDETKSVKIPSNKSNKEVNALNLKKKIELRQKSAISSANSVSSSEKRVSVPQNIIENTSSTTKSDSSSDLTSPSTTNKYIVINKPKQQETLTIVKNYSLNYSPPNNTKNIMTKPTISIVGKSNETNKIDEDGRNNEGENHRNKENKYVEKAVLLDDVTPEKIRTILKQNYLTQLILKYHPTNKPLSESDSRRIVEVIVMSLLMINDDIWENPHYEAIGKSIVTIFPKETIKTYYLPPVEKNLSPTSVSLQAQGKIPNKFRNTLNLGRQICHTTKKRSSNDNNVIQAKKPRQEDEAVDVQISLDWLKANEGPEELLMRHWAITASYRRKSIVNSSYDKIASIFDEWDAFKNVKFAEKLINIDFSHSELKATVVSLDDWHMFIATVLSVSKVNGSNAQSLMDLIDLEDSTETVKVAAQLRLLPHLLPPTGSINKITKNKKSNHKKTKCSILEAKDSILVVVPNENAIEVKRQNLIDESEGRPIQPFILCVGENIGNISKVFVSIDKLLLEVDNTFDAMDLCFKCFHVFHAKYPTPSSHIWTLIQKGLYKFETPHDTEYSTIERAYNLLVNP